MARYICSVFCGIGSRFSNWNGIIAISHEIVVNTGHNGQLKMTYSGSLLLTDVFRDVLRRRCLSYILRKYSLLNNFPKSVVPSSNIYMTMEFQVFGICAIFGFLCWFLSPLFVIWLFPFQFMSFKSCGHPFFFFFISVFYYWKLLERKNIV